MKIENAMIKDVTVGLNDNDRLCVRLSLKGQCTGGMWIFELENPVDVQRVEKLMQYTCSYEVGELEGKIVRKAVSGNLLRGIGHPLEDKFIPLWTEVMREVDESVLEELAEKL